MNNKEYREIYETLPEEDKNNIDGMFNAISKFSKLRGIKLANDDRAEMFIGAITEYYIASKEA
jgi:hypothetical protein